jgi:hypothetical protein
LEDCPALLSCLVSLFLSLSLSLSFSFSLSLSRSLSQSSATSVWRVCVVRLARCSSPGRCCSRLVSCLFEVWRRTAKPGFDALSFCIWHSVCLWVASLECMFVASLECMFVLCCACPANSTAALFYSALSCSLPSPPLFICLLEAAEPFAAC